MRQSFEAGIEIERVAAQKKKTSHYKGVSIGERMEEQEDEIKADDGDLIVWL